MTTVPTALHLVERTAGESTVWIPATQDRRWALELFTNLVRADAQFPRRFAPDGGARLVLLADVAATPAGAR